MLRQITAVVQTSAEPVSLLETINLNKKESVLAAESVVKVALKIVAVVTSAEKGEISAALMTNDTSSKVTRVAKNPPDIKKPH